MTYNKFQELQYLLLFTYLESRRGQIESISSIKTTARLPNFACFDASAKASLKIFSLSPACARLTEWGLQNTSLNQHHGSLIALQQET